MALVAPMGVVLTIHDLDRMEGWATWQHGETFMVVSAMGSTGLLKAQFCIGDRPIGDFQIGLNEPIGAFAGDSFVLQGAGLAIAANIYELIDKGVFLNGQA